MALTETQQLRMRALRARAELTRLKTFVTNHVRFPVLLDTLGYNDKEGPPKELGKLATAQRFRVNCNHVVDAKSRLVGGRDSISIIADGSAPFLLTRRNLEYGPGHIKQLELVCGKNIILRVEIHEPKHVIGKRGDKFLFGFYCRDKMGFGDLDDDPELGIFIPPVEAVLTISSEGRAASHYINLAEVAAALGHSA